MAEEKPGLLDPKANLKSLTGCAVIIGGIAAFLLLAGIAWWLFSRTTGIGNPTALLKPAPTVLDQTFTLDAHQFFSIPVVVQSGRVPGTLQGHFSVRGKSAGIAGATDDTLVDFYIKGPNNERLNGLDHPTDGNFSIKVTAPATYTLVFSNAGIIRSSGRRVTLTGKYQPD